MIPVIRTTADVEAFANQLVREGLTGGFNPDDPFEDYTDKQGNPLYTHKEADFRNGLMSQCFEVCGDSIYEIMGRITMKDTPFESIFDHDHEESYKTFMQLVELGVKEYEPSGVGSRKVKDILSANYN